VTTDICLCGIARVDCDYHRPQVKVTNSTTKAIAHLNLDDPKDNPFLTNDLTKRAEYMCRHPNTYEAALKAAGLQHPWDLHPV
jgi:hypothetical protein